MSIHRVDYERLILAHGRNTHCLYKEGGMWWKVQEGAAPILSMAHALCFADGTQWDEINGIRPKECTWPPDAPQKDLRG